MYKLTECEALQTAGIFDWVLNREAINRLSTADCWSSPENNRLFQDLGNCCRWTAELVPGEVVSMIRRYV